MPNLSFEIDTAKKFYFKLLEDHEDFLKDTTSSRHAINCAMTAFHLSEWIYHEYGKGQANQLKKFQASLEVLCPELKVMHNIANGSKHFHTRGNTKTGWHGGAFSSASVAVLISHTFTPKKMVTSLILKIN